MSQIEAQKVAIVQSMEVDMVEMEQKRMYEGFLSTGEATTPYYTPFTVAMKNLKNQPTDRVTLKDTGDFYNAMFVEVIGDIVVFDSKDYKSEDLKEKYGDYIFGLTEENRTDVKGMFSMRLLQWFRELTKL